MTIAEKTALLTLGRLPKALDIAQALSFAGWRVVIAEPAKHHLAGVSRHVAKSVQLTAPNEDQAAYLNGLLAVVDKEQVSLIVPVSEEALHASLIADRLPSGVRFYGPSHEELVRLHNKRSFTEYAASLGLAVPKTAVLGSVEARAIMKASDFIIKPVATCSGQGFSAHHRGERVKASASDGEIIVQEKLQGPVKSTFSIAHEGRVLGTSVYEPAILSGTVAVAFRRLEKESAIEAWVADLVASLNHSGFIAFDFMQDAAGIPHAIECNPRATSGIHFLERSGIAAGIVEPESVSNLRMKPAKLMQQFFPSLTETQSALFKRDDFKAKFKTLIAAKEVNFSWSDPLPLWLMPFTSIDIMRRAFLQGQSFGEAATHDIGWYS